MARPHESREASITHGATRQGKNGRRMKFSVFPTGDHSLFPRRGWAGALTPPSARCSVMPHLRLSPLAVRWVVYGAIFLASFGCYLSTAVKGGALNAPPEPGDGHDFDALAFNIWRHGRFGFEWSNPEWRWPYQRVPGYESLLERESEYYPTTYRPPAAPAL